MIHPFDLTTPETPNLVSYDLEMALSARKYDPAFAKKQDNSRRALKGWQTRGRA